MYIKGRHVSARIQDGYQISTFPCEQCHLEAMNTFSVAVFVALILLGLFGVQSGEKRFDLKILLIIFYSLKNFH